MSAIEAERSTRNRQVFGLPVRYCIAARTALLFGPLPLVIAFLVQLWQQRPHYQFVPIYLAALGGLWWINRPRVLLDGGNCFIWQRAFLIVGLIAFGAAATAFSPWLGMVAWLLLVPAAFLDVLPRLALQKLLPVWMISWFVLPPPFHWDDELLQWLRSQTSSTTGIVLDALGVIYIQAGNTFEVPGKQFFIEDACSGIHSLLSIVGVALLWTVYLRLPFLASICSVVCAAAAAIALNVIRVLTVVLAWSQWELDLSKGWQHELLGIVLFAVGLLFLASAQQFWLFWFSPLVEKTHRRSVLQPPATMPSQDEAKSATGPRWLKWAATVALVLWVPQVNHCVQMFSAAQTLHASLDPRKAAFEVGQQSLPMQLNGWKRIDHREVARDRHHMEGEFSRQWTYQAPWGLVQVSFDFPFEGPHPLLRCYESTGWRPTVQKTASSASTPGAFQQVLLKRREFEVGSLIYGLWDEHGVLVTPRAAFAPNTAPQPFLSRLWNRLAPAATPSAVKPLNTYQFQVLVSGEFPLGEAEEAELLQFFLESREQVRRRFTAESPETATPPASNSTAS